MDLVSSWLASRLADNKSNQIGRKREISLVVTRLIRVRACTVNLTCRVQAPKRKRARQTIRRTIVFSLICKLSWLGLFWFDRVSDMCRPFFFLHDCILTLHYYECNVSLAFVMTEMMP